MPESPGPTLRDDERGMLSLSSLFAILGLVVGFALVANVGKTVGAKLEAQNAADAAAYAGTVEVARGLNAVTAANHVVGELQAFCVLHHALGGDQLDSGEGSTSTPAGLKATLTTTHSIAKAFSSGTTMAPIGYDTIKQDRDAGGALWDASMDLKRVTAWAYVTHAGGAILTKLGWVPVVGPALVAIGQVMVALSVVFEGKAVQEWVTLDIVEGLARLTRPVKKLVEAAVIPGVYLYSCAVAGAVPGVASPVGIPGVAAKKAEDAAFELGEKHGCEAGLFPGLTRNPSFPLLGVPVVAEPRSLKQSERSQLVRASTPWVQRWRIPWMRFGEQALLLSRFKCHYKKWTDHFTLELAKRAKTERAVPINLLVLRGLELDGEDKTREEWAVDGGSAEADRLFAVVGLARRPAGGVSGGVRFRQANPDGFVAFAQGLVYNANPQDAGRHPAGWQRAAGWDTLNWDGPVPEYPGPSPAGDDCPIPRVPEPRIKLNWRAKLVPTTRLVEATLWQQGETGDVLRRTASFLPGVSNTR